MNGTNRFPKLKFYFVQALTLSRVPLILVFLIVNLATDTHARLPWFWVAFGALIVAAVSDAFDGYFARKFGVTSRLGTYVDPLTDKVLYLTACPVLVYLAAIHQQAVHAKALLVVTVLFLVRDQWVSFLRSIGALHKVDAKAHWSGKLRTGVSFTMVCYVYYYLQTPAHWLLRSYPALPYALEIAAVAATVLSACIYTSRYWPWLKKEMQMRQEPRD